MLITTCFRVVTNSYELVTGIYEFLQFINYIFVDGKSDYFQGKPFTPKYSGASLRYMQGPQILSMDFNWN